MVSDPEGDACDNPGHRGCCDGAGLSTAVLDCRCAQSGTRRQLFRVPAITTRAVPDAGCY